MREALRLTDISIPRFEEALSPEGAARISDRLQEWDASNFAGYRRLVSAGSDCYPDFAQIKKIVGDHQRGGTGKPLRQFVILGTGGSSLGGEAILQALHPHGKAPFFHVMDNNDPDWYQARLDALDPEETLFYVVSKSGKTPETLSQFLTSIPWVQKKVGGDWKKHFVVCTDPKSGDLRTLAQRWKLSSLPVPSPVGGRFSVLSPVGLFPAAFAGLLIEELIAGANSVLSWDQIPLEKNPCAKLARALAHGQKEFPVTVHMPYSTQLGAFSRWFCQLWAESLGKDGQGLTPYPAIGTTDQHSQMQLYMEGPRDKVVLLVQLKGFAQKLPLNLPEGVEDLPAFLELKNRSMRDLFDAEFRATRDALTKAGVPNATLQVDKLDEYSLGALFYFWEWATAIAGAVIGVNPFDQPGVEAAKVLTKKYLAEV